MRVGFIICTVMMLLGCGRDVLDQANAGRMRLNDPREQEQMKAALSNAQIYFEVHNDSDGNEKIRYDSRVQGEVLRIRDELFGAPPPMGRNITLGSESMVVFSEEMRRRGSAFRTGMYHGSQYVAWAPESDEASDAALEACGVNPEMLTEMKRVRKLVDAERDRTNRSSRSREERAPAER